MDDFEIYKERLSDILFSLGVADRLAKNPAALPRDPDYMLGYEDGTT